MPGPRKATRIQTAARKIAERTRDDDPVTYKLALEIIELAERQDARTGRLDPRLRKRKATGRR